MNNKTFTCGALFSVPDLRDYVAKSTTNDFPEEFELKMPSVKNQGSVGSCVAHSVALVAEYFNNKETGKRQKLSTGYIYGNRLLSVHKGHGMITNDALKTAIKFGDVTYDSFPENVETPYAIELFDNRYNELETAGANYKFKSYYKLKTIEAMKEHLMTVGPIVMSMWWFDDIEVTDGVMHTNEVKTAETGGHCMVIYGWNSIGWKVQNSWGTRWGNKGKFIMPYKVSMKEAWGVTDAASDSSLVIVKPFASKIGAFFAKTVHKVISWGYNIIYKLKRK